MPGKLILSDQGIFVRVDDEPTRTPGIVDRSNKSAVRGVQASGTSRGSAGYFESNSTVAGAPVMLVRGKGDLLRVERWNGAGWTLVASIANDGTLDAANILINGAPISGASAIADQRLVGNVSGGSAVPTALTSAQVATFLGLGNLATATTLPVTFGVACSDETTALTTGTAKVTFRLPHAMTLTAVRSSLSTVSSSGLVTVDINEAGVSVLSTTLSIDQGEKTSTTAATPAVISDASLADDAEITVDIDAAGTGAKGLKVWLIGTRAAP